MSHIDWQGCCRMIFAMNVLIGHGSALQYWRSITLDNPGAYDCAFQPARSCLGKVRYGEEPLRLEDRDDFLPRLLPKSPSFADCKPDPEALKKVEMCGAGCFEGPISFIVGRHDQRWRSERAVCHVHEQVFPRGSFVRLSEGVYVASPELCFVQMASTLTLPKLLLLGCEFCGSFTTHGGGYAQRPPLSNTGRMKAYVSRADAIHGVKKARQDCGILLMRPPLQESLRLLCFLACLAVWEAMGLGFRS